MLRSASHRQRLAQEISVKAHSAHQTIVAARHIEARKLRTSLSERVKMRRKSFSRQKAFSMWCRSRYAALLKLNRRFRCDRFGMTLSVSRSRCHPRSLALSYALSR